MALPTFTVSASGSQMGAVGSSFAYDLTKRISQGMGLDATQEAKGAKDAASATPEMDAEQAAAQEKKQGQLQKLESALADTVAYMKDKHGDQAASAMIGLVYKRLGDGEINEQTLGEAFLDVTRFIDKNFGTDSGDAFMSHLNGNLNNSLNAFFDNGQNETFMVAPTSTEGGGGGIDTTSMLQDITKQYAEAIKEMLEEARAKPEDSLAGPYADPMQKDAMLGVMKDVMV